MNHDYAHCSDYDPKHCPPNCFRAELVKDLRSRTDMIGIPVSWAHLKGTPECLLGNVRTIKTEPVKSKLIPAADVVEVVRCKECRFGRETYGNIGCFAGRYEPIEYHGYDWYCPKGERREQDEVD